MESNWLEWLGKQSIWLRAILAALATVGLMDYGFAWERVDFLATVHALILIWDMALGWAMETPFRWLGLDIKIPTLTRHLIVVFSTFYYPVIFSILKARYERTEPGERLTTLAVYSLLLPVLSVILSFGLLDSSFWYAFHLILFLAAIGLISILSLDVAPKTYLKRVLVSVIFIFTLEILRLLPGFSDIIGQIVDYSKTL